MSGICGWIGGRNAAAADISAMAAALPQGAGQATATANAGEASFGAVSQPDAGGVHYADPILAAIEGTPRWTDAALADRATRDGHAAALAEGWRAHGRSVLDRLHGSFALAVAEPAAGRMLLAVDRFGICTMKYARLPGGGIVFGSSADAVLSHGAVEACLSPQGLLFYLCFFVVPAPISVWRGVEKLMAGHYLSLEPGGRCEARHYWKTPYGNEPVADEAALARDLRTRLDAAVRRSVEGRSATEIAGFLSGGLDSSSVCGALSGIYDEPVKAFTIGFADQRYDETPYARLAAERFGLDHRVIRLEESDAIGFVESLAAAYDEPFGNSSAIPAYFCARAARETGVRLLVAGDGGDEIFGGNERYLPPRRDRLYRSLPSVLRKVLTTPLLKGAARFGGSALHDRVVSRLDYVETPMPDRLLAGNWLLALGAASVFGDAVLDEIDPAAPLRWLRDVYDGAATGDALQRHMHLDMQITLADNDLRKVTRMCELAGCDVRFPMLDEKLVDFAAAIPGRVLVRGGELRGFYKRALSDFLPPGIIGKKKHGFGMPFGEWMKHDATLHQLARDSLAALARRRLLRPEFLEEVVRGWEQGTGFADGGAVWDLMMFELWLARRGSSRVRLPETQSRSARPQATL